MNTYGTELRTGMRLTYSGKSWAVFPSSSALRHKGEVFDIVRSKQCCASRDWLQAEADDSRSKYRTGIIDLYNFAPEDLPRR